MIFKIGLLQMKAQGNNQEANYEKAINYCREALKKGVDMVLFPEMWNIGYTPHHEEVWEYDYNPMKPKHPELLKQWKKLAVSLDSEYIKGFCKLAKELNIAIAVTYLRANSKGDPFNCISIIDRNGKVVLTYDKIHTCDFSMEYHCSPGNEFKVVKLETEKGVVNIGAMICYDREFPESARILMLRGAEIIIVPNACELEINRLCQLRARAYENMVGIAVCNYAGQGFGNSVAYDGIGFNSKGSRDMTIVQADLEERIVISEFNLTEIRKYRESETWGNSFRKPKTYKELIVEKVKYPFIRDLAKR
jgi:predicted amidohydrolase